jgi:hypothetical protein
MPESPNPFEPPPAFPLEPNPTGQEQIQRVRYVVSMWVCGFVGIASMPPFPLAPDRIQILYGSASIRWWFIMAWITPFVCGIASVATAVCLFRLPRISDKIGALAAIILVGFLPVFGAVYSWSVILFPWSSNR